MHVFTYVYLARSIIESTEGCANTPGMQTLNATFLSNNNTPNLLNNNLSFLINKDGTLIYKY